MRLARSRSIGETFADAPVRYTSKRRSTSCAYCGGETRIFCVPSLLKKVGMEDYLDGHQSKIAGINHMA